MWDFSECVIVTVIVIPTDLLDSVRKHVRAYSELLAVFGRSLNMSPGKTEAFVTFRGQGAKDAASKLVHQDDYSHVPLHDGRLLRVVRSCVHLGTLTTPSGSYAQEVSRRTHSMLHAYLPLAKSTFGEPSFPIKTRLVLAESLLFTRLTFALGSWDPLPLGLKLSMEAARMRVFRMILGEFRKEGGLSDRAVREKLAVCSFDVLVRRHRLLCASRVTRKAPSLLRALLQNVGGAMFPWTQALVDDLAALKRAAPKKLEELPPFEDDPQKWILVWTRYPRQWAQLVKLLPLNDYDDELPDAFVTCEVCSRRFNSARALAVHRSRAHGKKRLAPQLVDGSTCPACRTDFRTRLRRIHHLEYSSPKRREVIASEVLPLSLERARELAAIDASPRRRAKKAGVSFLAAGVPCIPAPQYIPCTVFYVLSLSIQWSAFRGSPGSLCVHLSSAQFALAVRKSKIMYLPPKPSGRGEATPWRKRLDAVFKWTDGLLMSLPTRCLPVLMLDLNDRLGRPRAEESLDLIGEVGAGNERDSATRFRALLRRHSIAVPSTFHLATPTFDGSSGRSRIDLGGHELWVRKGTPRANSQTRRCTTQSSRPFCAASQQVREVRCAVFMCWMIKQEAPEYKRSREQLRAYSEQAAAKGKGHGLGPPGIAAFTGLLHALSERGSAVGAANAAGVTNLKQPWDDLGPEEAFDLVPHCKKVKVYDPALCSSSAWQSIESTFVGQSVKQERIVFLVKLQ